MMVASHAEDREQTTSVPDAIDGMHDAIDARCEGRWRLPELPGCQTGAACLAIIACD